MLLYSTLLLHAVFAATPPTQATFNPTTLPYELQRGCADRTLRGGYQRGGVTFRAFESALEIQWTANALNNSTSPPDFTLPYHFETDSIGSYANHHAQQTLPTRFYPTACCVVDSTYFLVAGVTTQGAAIIERWELAWPSPMPTPAMDATDGRTHVHVATPAVARRERLYETAPLAQRYVRNLAGLQRSAGPTQAVLVQFHDSSDVLRLDLTTRQFTTIASGSNSSATLGQVPSLATNCERWVEFGDRIGLGYAYRFRIGTPWTMTGSTVGAPPSLVLIDQDRDGELDQFVELFPSESRTGGWWDLANFANWWLY
jgi:hypothetical protein